MKTIFKITALAALMVGATHMAHADRNANVEITGHIVAQTCDLSVPQPSYDLGNWSAADFKVGAPLGEQKFLLTVKHCTGTLEKDKELTISTIETGIANGADTNLYGDDAGTNAGILLTMAKDNGNATQITPAENLFVVHKGADETPEDLAGKEFPVTVTAALQLGQGKAAANVGALKANLQFTMAE